MVFVGTAREFRVADALARLHLRIADTYYDLGDFRAAEELLHQNFASTMLQYLSQEYASASKPSC